MEILPIAKENCLSMFKILPNTKTPQKLDFYFFARAEYFAKSRHTLKQSTHLEKKLMVVMAL